MTTQAKHIIITLRIHFSAKLTKRYRYLIHNTNYLFFLMIDTSQFGKSKKNAYLCDIKTS